jgi:Tfp pilus assembly protein PilN
MRNPFQASGQQPNSFLPEDYIARRSDARANILVLSVFAVVMAAVVGAFLVTYRQKVALRERLVVVTEQYNAEAAKIEQLKALESQRSQIMEKAQLTAALVERLPRWAVHQEITMRMAPSMRLHETKIKSTRIDPPAPSAQAQPPVRSLTDKVMGKKDEAPKPQIQAPKFTYQVTITGGAKENNDIADYLRSLRESPIFEDVELAYIREGRGDEALPRKFEISATLRSDAEPEEVGTSLRALIAARKELLGIDESRTADAAGAVEEGAGAVAGAQTKEEGQ